MKPFDFLDALDQEDKEFSHSNSYGVPGSICGAETRFHEESIGSQVEFFDDHQKWLIESFDDL